MPRTDKMRTRTAKNLIMKLSEELLTVHVLIPQNTKHIMIIREIIFTTGYIYELKCSLTFNQFTPNTS